MTLDGRYRAVLDRIEDVGSGSAGEGPDELAVLLIENERGDEILEERTVPGEKLPSGVGDGAVLTATFEGDDLRRLVYEPAETERRRTEMQDRFDRLAERPPGRNGGSQDEGDDANDDADDAADDADSDR